MEWIWEALGIIGIAVILYAIFWFLLPDITRPLPPKKSKVTFIPRDGKAVEISGEWNSPSQEEQINKKPRVWVVPTGVDGPSYLDYTDVKVTPIKDPEYAEYLKNFPADDPRR